MSPSRFIVITILVLTTTLYGMFIYRTAFIVNGKTSFTLVDDAMISMRYADNLASGNGLVWNAGERPIEGFTNLLWVGVMAALHLTPLSASGISLAVMICSVLALTTNLMVVWRITREVSPESWLGPALAVFLTGLYFPLVYWSLRGMELGLIFLTLNLSTLCLLRLNTRPAGPNLWTLAASLSLALMTRPDTVVQVAVLLIVGVAVLLRAGKTTETVLLAGTVFITGLALVAFRAWYFGEAFPNTYYLKMTGVTAMERIDVGVRVLLEKSGPTTLFLASVAAGAFFVGDSRLRRTIGLFLMLFAFQAAYSIYVGGDFAEELVGGEGRFLAQAFGPLILAYSLVVPRLLNVRGWDTGEKMRCKGVYLLLVVGLGSVALISGKEWKGWSAENAPLLIGDIERARRGLLLHRGTRDDAVIAVHAAGNTSYYCRRRVIDLLGKSDRVIARSPAKRSFIPGHNKWDYEYALGTMRPDVIADEWPALWEYILTHPGQYTHLLPGGIFVLSGSAKVSPHILGQDTW